MLRKMEWTVGIAWAVNLTAILVVSSLWLFVTILKKKNGISNESDKKETKSLKGNTGWPLIGETLDFIASGYNSQPLFFMEKRKSLYGSVFKTNILGSEVIASTDPEVNKVILHNQGNVFVPAYPKSIRELMGDHSILQATGNAHRRLHSVIGGFLRSPVLKARITTDIERSVTHCLATWTQSSRSQQLVYLQDEVKKITFTILVKVLMSVGPGEDLDWLTKEFQEFIKGLICVPINFPGTRLYKSLKAKERIMKMVMKIIEEREKKMNDNNGEEKGAVNDTVDALLGDCNDEGRMSFDTICGNIIGMMIPGDETLPTAMTLAVKFLSDSPLVVAKLREENMEFKKHKSDSSDGYAWTDYMSLPFTQHVISETLRLANIVNAIWRKSTKDVEIKGYHIPKGRCVVASIMSVHMEKGIYENPFEFNPWRWEKIGAVASNNCFTPFGGGQRLCPGLELSKLELSIFLHHLVTTYRWEVEKDEIVYFPTVKMRKRLPIRVTPIDELHVNA